MAASPLTEAEILGTWQEPRPRIQGMPTFHALRALLDYLKTNAMKIETPLGGGNHGHLFLVVTDTAWALLAPNHAPFVPPAHPGGIPNYPDQATSAEIAEIRAQYDEDVRVYATYKNCQSALRSVIIAAVDPIYLRAMRDPTTHFAHLTPRQLLDHLFDSYGKLPPQEIAKLRDAMEKPWDPTQPFEVVIDQIEEAVDTAIEAGQPFTRSQVLNTAYVLVHATGMFGDACKEWRKLTPAQQTWPAFKQHFIEATIQLRLDQQATSGHHGYANATVEALTRIAEAAAADKLVVANLTAAHSDLSASATTLSTQVTSQLTDLTNLVTALQAEVASLKTMQHRGGNRGTQRPNRNRAPHPTGYCWSHGAYVTEGHTSATCRSPKEGHKKEATRDNRLGGSNAGCTN